MTRDVALVLLRAVVPTWHLLGQCPDGSAPPCRVERTRPSAAPAWNSVAVLYFDNLSPDTADAYLADGLTEELIARLGQLERLEVKSRTVVRRYRGEPVPDPGNLGRRLNVAHLVSGSVRRAGTRLRVTIELVRAATGTRVWGDQYDRTDADLLVLQEEIARAVVTAIAGRLLPGERQVLAVRPTVSPKAYDHFLRGNFHLARRTPPGTLRAIDEYEAAARLDPRFTAPLARLAYAYALALDWGWELGSWPADTLVARGATAAQLALRRDSSLSDAWMAEGYIKSFVEPRTFAGVREAFERAIVRDPRNAEAHHQYAFRLLDLGEDSLAAAAFHRALEVEPDRPISLIGLAVVSVLDRRYDVARRWTDSALALDPGFAHAYDHRAVVQSALGQHAAARRDALTAQQLRRGTTNEPVWALTSARAGDTAAARASIDRSRERVLRLGGVIDPDGVTWLIGALVALGDRQGALDALDALQPRGPRLAFVLRAPEFDALRDDPRFQRLVEESRAR